MGQVLGTPDIHLAGGGGGTHQLHTSKNSNGGTGEDGCRHPTQPSKKSHPNFLSSSKFQCGGDARVAYSGRAACEAAAAGTKKQLLAAGINDDDIFKQLDATNLSRHFSTQSGSEYGPTDLILVIRDTHPGIPSNNKAIQQLTGFFKFEVHRQVLMDKSLYFRAMLSAFREKDQPEVTLYSICDTLDTMRELVAKILTFIYFDKIHLSPGTVQEVMLVANYFQIEELQRLCNEYLLDTQLRKRTCVPLYLSALLTGPYSLQRSLETYILENFESLAGSKPYAKEFVRTLTKAHLINFLSSKKLHVTSEGVLFTAVLRWVGHSPRDRLEDLPELLDKVHLKLMSGEDHKLWTQFSDPLRTKNEVWLAKSTPPSSQKKALRKLCSNPLVSLERVPPTLVSGSMSSAARQRLGNLVDSTSEYFEKSEESKKDYWCRQKSKPHRWPKVIAVVRVYWKSIAMEYYEPRSRKWAVLSEMDCWRSCTAVAAHDSTLYLLGGEETDCKSPTGSRTVNRVTKFDAEKQSWSSGTSMLLARRWAGAIVVDDTLYVVGGIGGKG